MGDLAALCEVDMTEDVPVPGYADGLAELTWERTATDHRADSRDGSTGPRENPPGQTAWQEPANHWSAPPRRQQEREPTS